jgi:hypothetical protein
LDRQITINENLTDEDVEDVLRFFQAQSAWHAFPAPTRARSSDNDRNDVASALESIRWTHVPRLPESATHTNTLYIPPLTFTSFFIDPNGDVDKIKRFLRNAVGLRTQTASASQNNQVPWIRTLSVWKNLSTAPRPIKRVVLVLHTHPGFMGMIRRTPTEKNNHWTTFLYDSHTHTLTVRDSLEGDKYIDPTLVEQLSLVFRTMFVYNTKPMTINIDHTVTYQKGCTECGIHALYEAQRTAVPDDAFEAEAWVAYLNALRQMRGAVDFFWAYIAALRDPKRDEHWTAPRLHPDVLAYFHAWFEKPGPSLDGKESWHNAIRDEDRTMGTLQWSLFVDP